MAGYEASEIMFASCMLFSDNELMDAAKDTKSLTKFMAVAKAAATKSISFGNESIRKEFLNLMEPTTDRLKDLVVGISAAIGIRKHISAKERKGTPLVYMTGNVWPTDVEKFRINISNFKDYNSSDVLFTYNRTKYYGISLKKKPTAKSPDPTLINKAFDSLLGDGDEFKTLRETLAQARVDYFAGIVMDAVSGGIIKKSDIKDFDKLTKTPVGRKELFEGKKRDRTKFDKAYIDTKGYASSKNGGYKDDNTRDPKSMRYFVNKKLADPNNKLWAQFISIMNQYSQLFGDSLVTIILKTRLYEELSAADLKKYKFSFFLVTGVGDVTKTSINVGEASVTALETTLCGLTRIEEKNKKKPYSIALNNLKKASADAAKVFMQLKRGNVIILDLELRYKGAFTSQPQFQATLNPEFKKLLKDECGV